MKRKLNGIEYICGSSFNEIITDEHNRDDAVLKKVFVKENLSCSSHIERVYYLCDFLKPVCIICGSAKNITSTPAELLLHYPKCNSRICKKEEDITRPKRKTVLASDLQQKKKKK